MRSLVTHALVFGLVLSVSLGALVLIVLRVNAEIMLDDYPADIRAKWGPMSERTKRQRVFVVVILLAVILAVVAWSLETLPAFVAGDMTFRSAFAYFAVMFGTFNVFDLVVLDFGLLLWQPAFVVLPGTEGMASYRSWWFSIRGFLIGIPIVLAGSVIAAGIVWAILRFR